MADETNTGPAPEVVREATEMGWIPKEQFKGDEGKWVDAETFVKRGREFIPFLQANNRKLQAQVNTLSAQVQQSTQLLQASQESIEELKTFNSEMARDRAKVKQTELMTGIREAREAGNVEVEVELTDQLAEQKAALKEAEKTKQNPPAKQNGAAPAGKDYTQDPSWKAWAAENTWFGTDTRRTSVAIAVANEMRADPAYRGLTGKDFLDQVAAEVDKTLGGTTRREAVDRVEGGGRSSSNGGGGSNGGGKGYAELPADAKEACEKQAKRLVGKGRAFADLNAWRKHYAEVYFRE